MKDFLIFQDGYTAQSSSVIDFWTILHEFGEDEKKLFLKFVTGRYDSYLLC